MRTLLITSILVTLFAAQGGSQSTPASDLPVTIPGDPAICITEPRPQSFFQPYLGTPGAIVSSNQRVLGTPAPLPTPQGKMVDPATLESVAALLSQYNACSTAGKMSSVSALMTDRATVAFIRNFGADFVSARHPESHATDLKLTSVVLQPDGSLMAVVRGDEGHDTSGWIITQSFHLVEEGSTWLIDDILVLSVASPDADED